MKNRLFAAAALSIAVSACTTPAPRLDPVDPSLGMTAVCILENHRVQVADFLPVLEQGFARHNVTTTVFQLPKPAGCEFVVTYAAYRSWAGGLYMSAAEIRIEKNGKEVAFAQYRVEQNERVSFGRNTKEKMDPIIDALLRK